jgi:hypothetical protein
MQASSRITCIRCGVFGHCLSLSYSVKTYPFVTQPGMERASCPVLQAGRGRSIGSFYEGGG